MSLPVQLLPPMPRVRDHLPVIPETTADAEHHAAGGVHRLGAVAVTAVGARVNSVVHFIRRTRIRRMLHMVLSRQEENRGKFLAGNTLASPSRP
jgi:hypothetical protein